MTAEHPEQLIGGFLDGELGETERRAVAAHLEGCAACAAFADELRAVGRRLRAAGRVAPPVALESRVRAALVTAEPPPPVRSRAHPVRREWIRFRALPIAASILVAATLGAAATWWALGGNGDVRLVTHDLLSAHLRALAHDGSIQVASADSHTIRPWFAGKVVVSPEARDLTAEGFQLVGGRLDIIEGQRVGVVMYRRRLHLIDVFAWPATSAGDTAKLIRIDRGYRFVSWTRAGVTYWAVSDLDAGELQRMADLL